MLPTFPESGDTATLPVPLTDSILVIGDTGRDESLKGSYREEPTALRMSRAKPHAGSAPKSLAGHEATPSARKRARLSGSPDSCQRPPLLPVPASPHLRPPCARLRGFEPAAWPRARLEPRVTKGLPPLLFYRGNIIANAHCASKALHSRARTDNVCICRHA